MPRHKKHGPAPIPPGNRPQGGTAPLPDADEPLPAGKDDGAPFQEQDPKRRLGDYGTQGEHPIQQPTPLNDGTQRSQ